MSLVGQMHLNTGQKASMALHGGLIAWIMLFDLFHAPDNAPDPAVTEVALVSASDFAAMTAAAPPPPPSAPAPAPRPAPPPQSITAPSPVTPPAPAPMPTPAPAPAPQSERPQAAVIAPTTTPDSSLRPVQRPAERVAPEPAPTPAPEVRTAPRDQAAIVPDATATITAPEAREATQREAAATETVTENTQISETDPVRRTATAPEVSLRPRARPARVETSAPAPTPAPAPAAAPAPATIATPATAPQDDGPSASAINDALAQALADPAPALSQADADALRLNIESCWNTGILSTEALNVVVTIGFEMTPDARPIGSSIRMVSASGGGAAAQQAAFEAGRQAIVQCGMDGYGLPQDLYDQWRLVEITFNPARMSTR